MNSFELTYLGGKTLVKSLFVETNLDIIPSLGNSAFLNIYFTKKYNVKDNTQAYITTL